jgi:Flp pilus assembly protein TadG
MTKASGGVRAIGDIAAGMACALRRALRRLVNDQRGAVLLYVSVALLPLLTVVGVAVDLGRIYLVKQRLTNAADAAAIAVGTQANLTPEQATDLAGSFIQAHYPGELKSLGVSNSATEVSVTVTAQVSMVFLTVLNTQSVDVTVNAQALRPQGKLEIALVLDQTGSMAGQRMVDLKAAAKDLIDIVVWDNQTENYYSKVAIVPYAAGVNVGEFATGVRGSILSGTCLSPGCQVFQFLNPQGQVRLHNVSTCVSERTGTNAFTDAAPTVALLGTNYPPSSNPCPSNTIVPLTNDKSKLKGAIDAMAAGGSTAGHIGVAWGWYLLSPDWGYLWPASQPAPYSELGQLDAKGLPLLQKIIVLMTDGGFNTAYCQGVVSKDSSTGGSSADQINCSAPNGSSFAQAKTVCTNAKAKGIKVFTVGLGVGGDASAKDVMAHCATDASHAYLAATGEELRQAFREIATKVSTLRLSN